MSIRQLALDVIAEHAAGVKLSVIHNAVAMRLRTGKPVRYDTVYNQVCTLLRRGSVVRVMHGLYALPEKHRPPPLETDPLAKENARLLDCLEKARELVARVLAGKGRRHNYQCRPVCDICERVGVESDRWHYGIECVCDECKTPPPDILP